MICTHEMLHRMIAQTRVLGIMGERDQLLMRTLFETRITVAELTHIRRSDLNLRRKTLRIRGSHARTFKVDPSLFCMLSLYSDATIGLLETGTERDALFPYAFQTPFTVRRVRALLDHYRRAAGIDECEDR